MTMRSDFCRKVANLSLSHVDRAIAFLWYYRQTQEFDERTAADLALDLHEEGFPKPNVTRLKRDLRKSRLTIKGHQKDSFQIDVRRLSDLDGRYADLFAAKRVTVSGLIIPPDWVDGTRRYIEEMVHQINGSYEYHFYDACAALMRRLMESLIIEIYVHEKRHHEIQSGGIFMPLERLIGLITADRKIPLGRNTPKIMLETKQLGDTAAHDRVYITSQVDIDDNKAKYRRMIQELLDKAGIRKM
jgi:hypothetical protein